jgi:site-specific DNA recombinase
LTRSVAEWKWNTAASFSTEHRQAAVVAHTLNDKQLLPRGNRTKPGWKLRWTTGVIGALLRNPLYAGTIAYAGERYRGQHTPIIEEAVFDRVQRILEDKERVLRFHGINHDCVLRGLLRCGQCKQAMTPGSTSHARKTYRYARCTTRDKLGTKGCPAQALAAPAIEQYVLDRIAEAAIDGCLARDVEAGINARIASQRQHYEVLRTQLPGPIANYAANASRFIEELTRLEGTARALVEARLVTETQRLDAAERQLHDAERALVNLEHTAYEARHIVGALRDFKDVWESMTTPNRGRLLGALVDHVVVDEPAARVDIHLVDFAADPDAAPAAPTAPLAAPEAAA